MTNEDTTVNDIPATETAENDLTIIIRITDKNLQYKSDFSESDTVFWLEAVKGLVMQNAFEKADMHKIDS